MRRLLSFIVHYTGNGRALDNAREQREALYRLTAELDALEERLASTIDAPERPDAAAA
jgi:hypothetical protein